MKEARCLLASNVDSPYLFDGPFNGLGFQLKERPWHEGLRTLLSDVCRGRKVASDAPVDGVPVVDYELSAFRRQMNEFEERHLRELGRDLAHCIEATCRTCDQGIPESELAAQLHHRLVRRQITPLQIRVASDGRSERYRNWTFSDAPIQRGATVSIFARQHGLHLGVTRTFAFESPDEETLKRHQHASLVLASAMYFSQVGWEMRETWSRLQRIYDKFGAAEEWRLAEQGMLTGYDACECAVTPGADVRLGAGNVVCWQPSVGGAMVGDSVLVRGEGQLCLTPASHWPTLSIEVKGTQIDVPDILRR
jgi:Xaa-Pro aminopeptidase